MKNSLLVLGFLVALATYTPAQEMSVISGKLLGYDGEPMPKACIELFSGNDGNILLQSIEASQDGGFEIKFKETGWLTLWCTGVNHRPLSIPMLVEKPLREKLSIHLRLYEYIDDLSQIKIIGDFNNFEIQSARPMTRQEDGTFVFEMDITASTFAYQILKAEKQYGYGINGTQTDDFVYDSSGRYRSVVKVSNGKVKIIFDPKKLLRGKPDDEAVVQFENPNSFQAQFYALAHEHEQRKDKWRDVRKAYMDAHQNILGFTYDWSADLAGLEKRIAQEKNPTRRQVLLIQYLDVGRRGAHEKLDKKLIEQAFAEISTTSPLWEMDFYLIINAVNWSDEPGKYDSYLNQVLEKHPYRLLRAEILGTKLDDAAEKGDTTKVRIFYNRLISEFGDMPEMKWRKALYDPNRAIMKGKRVPAFSVASLEQPGVIYTNESMQGKVYLIDFWGVWCPPCIAEMPYLHQAYEKFNDRNFEILTLSFDQTPENVTKFRSENWKMLWLHSFVEKGFDSDLAKAFEVQAIPKPILVDGNTNTILATDYELLGEQLEKTLARVLGEKSAMSDKAKH